MLICIINIYIFVAYNECLRGRILGHALESA